MSFRLSAAVLFAISFLAGAFLVVLTAGEGTPGRRRDGTAEIYAVLSVDEAVSDAEIRGKIAPLAGLEPPGVFSESGMWAFLDDFGGLERVPLERWDERIFSFDPRNDGYAERLRAFFVHGGRRFFFVPITGKSPGKFEKALPGAVGVPFSLDFYGYGAPLYPFVILFSAAGLGFVFLSRPLFPAAAVLPVMAALSLGGPRSLVMAAFLAGLTALLAGPLAEWFACRRYRGHPGDTRLWECLVPYRKLLFPALVMLVCYAALAAFGTVFERMTAGITAALVLGIFVCSVRAESLRGGEDHPRFRAVPILRESVKAVFFPPRALPFTLASIVALVPALFPGRVNAGGETIAAERALLVSEKEYLAHAAFQAEFSYRPLSGGDSSYHRYVPGETGLPEEGLPETPAGIPVSPDSGDLYRDIPPFPLADLVNFLENMESGAAVSLPGRRDAVPVLLLVFCSFSALLRPRWGGKRMRSMVVYRKRMVKAPERIWL
ncbi:MAG: hypothetical protein LBI86_10105 [Treponema sp.]|jgi:hypothetical protein|nr:hypothetical protein [Treponema sp.]